MLISCEKCATTYVLDDKLIPAAGAPVQCTRCGHVFTARPPGAEAGAQPAPTSTQMFGAPGAPGGAPGPSSPANKTVMFGVAGSDPTPAPQAPTNRTVMFGAPGAGAAPAANPREAPTNKTVMFGVPNADPPKEPSPASRTMMFGAPGAGASPSTPPAQAANKTMMFGAGELGPAPAAAPANANKTMMFGAPGSEAIPAPATGGPGGTNPRSTMMFGAQGAGGSPSQAPQQQKTSQTMMFGASGAGGAPSQPPQQQKTSQTMMFGTPVSAPPQAQGSGAPQPKTSQTMMFGTPAAVQPPAAPPQPAAQQKSSSTMIFGATPVVGPGPGKAPKLTESTVRIGPEDLERMMREHGSPGDGMTPPEGQTAAQERQNKTQMFAMADLPQGPTPPAGNDAVARGNKTQMFAMSEAGEITESTTGGGPKKKPAAGAARDDGAPRYDPSTLETFPPDGQGKRPDPVGVHTLLAPGQRATDGGLDKPRPASSTLQHPAHRADSPEATVIDDGVGAGRVELPPETPELLQRAGGPTSNGATQPVAPVEGDPIEAMRAQVARRNRIALIIISVVLVAAALGVTWKVFGRLLLSRAPPAAAIEGCEKALGLLRFDDSKSKTAAIEQLSQLVLTYPDFIEGHAALVTAVSLQLDDVQQRVRRIEQLAERKNTLVARYNKEKSPSNWETLARQLAADVDELIKEHKPLSEEGHALDTKAREAYKGLDTAVTRVGDPSKQAKLAAVRAQALFHGVSGTDQALVLSDRYEKLAEGSAPDGWIDLAIPEYAANARVSPELMTQALGKLEELHKRDSTFLRTYVLAARLHLIRKELEPASSDLDQVLSMRKEHDVAGELREWIRKLGKGDDKKDP